MGYEDIKVSCLGSSGVNEYNAATAVPDGIVAVGDSDLFSDGDWMGVAGKGGFDATIVKYDNNSNVVWKKNFGGSGFDCYNSVTAVPGGVVAVGCSSAFGNGDWNGVTGKGGTDAIIVKYDNNGNVVWKKNFGGSSSDQYYSVIAVSDGIVAAGCSSAFGNGDWAGVAGKGSGGAIIVKYDNNGNVVWKKNFGGTGGTDLFKAVIASSDGIVAVGYSDAGAFGNGDWAGVTGKGSDDAIIVKYDNNGNVVWKKNFGGSGYERYYSVTAVPGGAVAVGYSSIFNSGDWSGVPSKGGKTDAIVVKYDNNGNVVWKKNIGGGGVEIYLSVTTVSDGFVAAGYSDAFGNGDWSGLKGRGNSDAIVVKHDNNGNITWMHMIGEYYDDCYNAVTTIPGGVAAVGSLSAPINRILDPDEICETNASVVKYTPKVPVTDITGVPSATIVGTPLTLTGTAVPSDATYKNITWSVKNAGTTGATIRGNTLSTTGTGTVVVTATISNGATSNADFKKDFTIGVNSMTYSIAATIDSYSTISPSGTVSVQKGANQTFAFSAKSGYTVSSVTVDGTALTQQQIALGSYTFSNVTANHTISVKSITTLPSNYYITANVDSYSTISPSGTVSVQKGASQTFTFSAKSGYTVSSVTVDGTALTQQQMDLGKYTFSNVTADHTISVKSVTTPIKYHYITATADSNSTISPSGNVAVPRLTNQTFTISAKSGYTLSSVIVDGVALTQEQIAQGKYTFFNVYGNHTIDVKSVRSYDHFIFVTIDKGKNAITTGDILVYRGDSVTVRYPEETGYAVYSVKVNGKTISQEQRRQGYYTFTNVTANHTMEIIYKPTNAITVLEGPTEIYAGLATKTVLYVPSNVIEKVNWSIVNDVPLTGIQIISKDTIYWSVGEFVDYYTKGFGGPLFKTYGPKIDDALTSAKMWASCKSADKGYGVILTVYTPFAGVMPNWEIEPL